MFGQNDAPIDPFDRSKTTPLHLAAENGHDRLIPLLLDNGANIAQEDAYGRNMLELAILSHKRSVVRTVLQHRDWRKAMRTTFTASDKHGSRVPETPLRLLIRVFPDLATLVFDRCVSLKAPGKDKGSGEQSWAPSSGPPSALQFLKVVLTFTHIMTSKILPGGLESADDFRRADYDLETRKPSTFMTSIASKQLTVT